MVFVTHIVCSSRKLRSSVWSTAQTRKNCVYGEASHLFLCSTHGHREDEAEKKTITRIKQAAQIPVASLYYTRFMWSFPFLVPADCDGDGRKKIVSLKCFYGGFWLVVECSQSEISNWKSDHISGMRRCYWALMASAWFYELCVCRERLQVFGIVN